MPLDLSKIPEPIIHKRGTKRKSVKPGSIRKPESLAARIERKADWIEKEKKQLRTAYLPHHEAMLEAMKRELRNGKK